MIVTIDTETSGDNEAARVVEIALVFHDSPVYWSSLVQCSAPMALEARAAHHITDAELAAAPTTATVGEQLSAQLASTVYLAAHNSPFDVRMIKQTWPGLKLPERVIDTYRCALHLYPDAPRHSNQVLRYYIPGLNDSCLGHPAMEHPPHRAAPDALVTSKLLACMLHMKSPDELVRLSTEPILLKTVRFGKHFGMPWADVPRDYIAWIIRQNDFDPDTAYTAKHYFQHPRG